MHIRNLTTFALLLLQAIALCQGAASRSLPAVSYAAIGLLLAAFLLADSRTSQPIPDLLTPLSQDVSSMRKGKYDLFYVLAIAGAGFAALVLAL